MRVRLRAGIPVGTAIASIESVLARAASFNVHGVGVVHEYSMWCADNGALLRNGLDDRTVSELVVTPRYLAAGTVQPPAAAHIMIQDDIGDLRRQLEAIVADLKRSQERWRNGSVLVVPDTNVFLHHARQFDEIDWHEELHRAPYDNVRVVVPMIVVDELDRHKRTEHRVRASQALRLLEQYWPRSLKVVPLKRTEEYWVTLEALVDELDHVRVPDPDSELVDQAANLQALANKEVVVATGDVGMVLRARSQGLNVVRLLYPDPPAKRAKGT